MSMYNIGADYAIVGRVTTGTSVEGYIIIERNESIKKFISKREFEILALSKKVYNCSAQLYNNEVNLKGINCKISKLPRYTRDCVEIKEHKEKPRTNIITIKLLCKVREGREVIGYIVSEILPDGKVIKHYRDRNYIIKAAAASRVYMVKCQSNAGRTILRAMEGFSLSELPEITRAELVSKYAPAIC